MAEGNVARTAEVLGLARNNLYKRLASLGIDPDTFRIRRGNSAPAALAALAVTLAPEATGAASRRERAESPSALVSSSVTLTGRARGAILSPVANTSSAVAEQGPAEIPKARLRMSRSYYLRPDQVKAIDDACLDLPAVLREQMSPSKVVERFMDWGFDRFLAEVKDPGPKAAPRRATKKGGTE